MLGTVMCSVVPFSRTSRCLTGKVSRSHLEPQVVPC
jgi:hypothetical protein